MSRIANLIILVAVLSIAAYLITGFANFVTEFGKYSQDRQDSAKLIITRLSR